MIENILYTYHNGSYFVTLLKDGTKIRHKLDDKGRVEFPESIDLKITNQCNKGCEFCHEDSKPDGHHATLSNIIEAIYILNMSWGCEIAIGGGNPLLHPELEEILLLLGKMKLVCNLTINEMHLTDEWIDKLVEWQDKEWLHGIGISTQDGFCNQVWDLHRLKNLVFHCILGNSSPFEVLQFLWKPNKLKDGRVSNILLLGDKRYGRGIEYFKDDRNKLDYWKYHLPMLLSRPGLNLSFDNLAIEQLELKKLLSEEDWNKYYMGDDGQFSMYIDAVKMEYAKNSISERIPWNEFTGFRNC